MTGDDSKASELMTGGGLSWSWDLDLGALLAAVEERTRRRPASIDADRAAPEPIDDDQVEADFAEYLEAVDGGRSTIVPLAAVAGSIAESLPTSPDLAGWLASSPAGTTDDYALTGLAASYRRLASWAQAGELAAVAQMASRSAAADDRIGVDESGRPDHLSQDACGQVSLALTMSPSSASWWADLAVTLEWRLAATGAALRSGFIDLSRARAIAEATAVLDDDTARAVESRVLARAGDQTLGQLRSALRRAVIAADPHGADRRREEAERRARVTLYPDAEGTAGLAGYSLPGIQATAAMARITALAQALKASGAGGGIDLLRSKVFLGLLLDTLPYIPPAPSSPPDDACPPDACPPGDDCPPDDACPPDACPPGDDCPPGGGYPSDDGCPPSDNCPPDHGSPMDQGSSLDDCHPRNDTSPTDDSHPTDDVSPTDDDSSGSHAVLRLGQWPEVSAFMRPGPPAMAGLLPTSGGFLDLRVPWSTLTGDSTEPGCLNRLGAITPTQAHYLAQLAARDPAADWRVLLTRPDGQALAVGRVRRRSVRAGPAPPGRSTIDQSASHQTGNCESGADQLANHRSLVKRVTVTITQDELAVPAESRQRPADGRLPAMLIQVLDAAIRTANRVAELAAADAAAGGCAHTRATDAYHPPLGLKEYITARDVTCRFPTCRQPAARCDLDHTEPYDQGGKTCSCNLGDLCRYHHQLKQHRAWVLTQPEPGTFTWITPTGRTYTTAPDSHAALA